MQIAAGKVVSIDYILTDDEGDVIDSSAEEGLLAYLQGAGEIVPGLEKALEGKKAGDSFKVVVEPSEGYGVHDEAKIAVVSADEIEGIDELAVGTLLETGEEDGEQTVVVTKIEGNEVTIDANHPLAGLTLHFDVTVREVRDATSEEIAHGHAHGENGGR